MLSPKRTKYRKYHRGRMRGKATRGNEICFGNFGLQALEPNWITSRQIEAARRTITRYTKRGAKLWIRIFPDKTVTARAAESRMAKWTFKKEEKDVKKAGKLKKDLRR